MHFWKYQGAGNDFIMVDQRQQTYLTRDDTALIAFLCDRHFGIGADGLILLQSRQYYDFEMVYFNADGRESTMCGNGGRCIGAFARHLGLIRENGCFWAIDGAHEIVVAPGDTTPGLEWIELKMSDVAQIEVLAQTSAAPEHFVLNTGSPHYVCFVPDVDALDMVREGRAVRYSDRFRAEGINVNMVRETEDGLCIRTYERGVEDETLACGTGVTAAALAHFRRGKGMPGAAGIQVQAKGGNLKVRFTAHADGSFSDIWLCGPAQRVFDGNIDL